MSLDVLTPKGQQTLVDEAEAAAIWMSNNPGCRYISTPKNGTSAIDAILATGDVAVAVAETKCRYGLTLSKFRQEFGGQWLITMDKIVNASRIAASLGVPLYGFLYLVDDRVLLTQRIANQFGEFVVDMRCSRTATQRTVNGGQAVRCNAYIDMTGAKECHSNLPSPSPS